MFEDVVADLERAIGELEIPVDAAALARCCGLLDRFCAKVTAAVAAFDDAGEWRDDGSTSMTAWLRRHAGRSGREASSMARTGRRLAGLPVTAAAYEDGTLSSGQVQAIAGNLNDDTAPLFADAEAEMVPKLARLGVKQVRDVMRAWAAAAKDHLQPDPADEPEPVGPERSLHLSETMDGRGELSGSLDPEARALAETALRLADSPDSEAEPERTPARRRADAFVDILRFFLDHQTTQVGGRHRPHLNVIVDYEDLVGQRPCPHHGSHDTDPFRAFRNAGNGGRGADWFPTFDDGEGDHPAGRGHHGGDRADGGRASPTHGSGTRGGQAQRRGDRPRSDTGPGSVAGGVGRLGGRGGGRLLDGTVLDAATLHRLACDAGVHRVIMAGRSSILDYGWTTRTIPANLWAAVVARDRHCRFPECDRPPQWCEAHHIVPWEHGGPTSVVNLGLYCTRHHHVLHTPGWNATMQSDGTIHITDPQGRVHTTHPPGQIADLFAGFTGAETETHEDGTQRRPNVHRPAA